MKTDFMDGLDPVVNGEMLKGEKRKVLTEKEREVMRRRAAGAKLLSAFREFASYLSFIN